MACASLHCSSGWDGELSHGGEAAWYITHHWDHRQVWAPFTAVARCRIGAQPQSWWQREAHGKAAEAAQGQPGEAGAAAMEEFLKQPQSAFLLFFC